jgi:hypothetical protein
VNERNGGRSASTAPIHFVSVCSSPDRSLIIRANPATCLVAAFLHDRLADGVRNATVLLVEITRQGYTGGYTTDPHTGGQQ